MTADTTAEGRRDDRAPLSRRVPMIVGLVAMWMALWGTLSFANLLGGIAVAVVVAVFADTVKPRPVRRLQPAAALRYLRTFAVMLVVANWQVVKAVLRPQDIQPGIFVMRLRHASDAVLTLVANSITLTPGTLTLETERTDDDTALVYVHSIDLSDAEAVRRDVALLVKLAADAFGDDEAQQDAIESLAEHTPAAAAPDSASVTDGPSSAADDAGSAADDAGSAADDAGSAAGDDTAPSTDAESDAAPGDATDATAQSAGREEPR